MVLGAPAAGGYRGGIFDPLEGNQKRMSHKDVCTGYLGPGLPGRSQKRSRKVQFDGFMCVKKPCLLVVENAIDAYC